MKNKMQFWFRIHQSLLRSLIVVLYIVQLIASTQSVSKTWAVTITTGSVATDYNATFCQNTTHSKSRKITAIKSNDCINLYREKGCQGWFVRRDPYFYLIGEEVHNWDENNHLTISNLTVSSVGPCYEACNVKNWDNSNLTQTVEVAVYNSTDFQAEISVNGSDCVPFPENLTKKGETKYVKIMGDKNSCIELHATSNCSNEEYIILRPGYPNLSELSFKMARAVSICGKFCNTTSAPAPETIFEGYREDLDVTLGVSKKPRDLKHVSFNISSCVNMPTHPGYGVVTVNSNAKKYLNIYSEKNCKGKVIRWQPFYKDLVYSETYHWGKQLSKNEAFAIKSIGPCKDKCDPEYLENSKDVKEVNVTLYKGGYFHRINTVLHVKSGECLTVPDPFSQSIEIFGNISCIELHKTSNCEDTNYAFLRPGYPELSNLFHHGLDEDAEFGSQTARGVSLCGSFCEKRKHFKEINDPPKDIPGEGFVTIFDHPGYYGNYRHYNLSQGCYNFKPDKLSFNGSLLTYGQCVVTFGSKDYRRESVFTETLQTSGKSVEYYREKLTSFTFPLRLRSMRFCNESEIANNTDLELQQATTIIANNTDLGQQGATITANSPSEFLVSFTWAVAYVFVIYTILIFTLGAYIGSKYRADCDDENSTKVSVLYRTNSPENAVIHLVE